MTIRDVLDVCFARGVRLVVRDGQLRAQAPRGAVSEALGEGLAEHKQALVEMVVDVWPDYSLPDVIRIPASVPNTIEAINACIDAQRVRVA